MNLWDAAALIRPAPKRAHTPSIVSARRAARTSVQAPSDAAGAIRPRGRGMTRSLPTNHNHHAATPRPQPSTRANRPQTSRPHGRGAFNAYGSPSARCIARSCLLAVSSTACVVNSGRGRRQFRCGGVLALSLAPTRFRVKNHSSLPPGSADKACHRTNRRRSNRPRSDEASPRIPCSRIATDRHWSASSRSLYAHIGDR